METMSRAIADGPPDSNKPQTPGAGQSVYLSLLAIETVLLDLITLREEMLESSEDVAAVDEQITAYIRQEVVKVDNIRSFWRHCELMRDAAKAEAETQAQRAKAWGSRLDRLKETCRSVMETIPFPTGKPRKLEGRTGSLLLKANGGKQAVEISNESMVPDELCTVTVTMSAALWNAAAVFFAEDLVGTKVGPRTPSLSLIGEALAKPCAKCAGLPTCRDSSDPVLRVAGMQVETKCPECGGSGCAGVPGARLAERGQHVECR